MKLGVDRPFVYFLVELGHCRPWTIGDNANHFLGWLSGWGGGFDLAGSACHSCCGVVSFRCPWRGRWHGGVGQFLSEAVDRHLDEVAQNDPIKKGIFLQKKVHSVLDQPPTAPVVRRQRKPAFMANGVRAIGNVEIDVKLVEIQP